MVDVIEAHDGDVARLSRAAVARGSDGVARVEARAKITAGSRVSFRIDPTHLHFFDATTTEAILN